MKKLIILLLISMSVKAQKSFESGSYITNDGVNKSGLIKNVGWNATPESFIFKESESQDSKTITSEQANEFQISGFKFKKFTFDLDESVNKLSQISENREPNYQTKTDFLRVLLEGNISLYEYSKGNITRFFISENNSGKLIPLVYKKYKQKDKVLENTEFRKQLSLLYQNQNATVPKILKVNYNREDLTDFLQQYDPNAISLKSTDAAKLNLKILLGGGIANAKATRLHHLNSFNIDDIFGLKIGIELEHIFAFNRNKWSLFVAPNFQTFSSKKDIVYGNNLSHKSELKNNFLQFPVGARHYFFLNDNSKIFVNAGYAFNFLSSKFSYQNDTVKTKPNAGFLAGIGFNYKKFGLEARYEPARQILETNRFYTVDFQPYTLTASYTLF
ncbi:hypothetical protein GV828_08755 [Flavobacterium sp. NST-5]|uniref:Outer membrane protein beta-barrel domain-containing protein n=1 Tax=Flavobacterium ichthyis TaxID=2698827 RepID=A0ABW9Z8U6_9FLAO|nr:porin family protein [Flavobacterium ichthyis]NBL65283.1 hypothetical protein [Flavobacterium ichthyis]